MAIFSVNFSYTSDNVVYHKTAVVRATTPDVAKEKVVNFCLSKIDRNLTSFAFSNISVSTYNFLIV